MPDTGPSPLGLSLGTRLLDAMLIGLPDAVTAFWCLWVWIHPLAFGSEAVKCVELMLIMEFILLNATGLFCAIPFMLALGRSVRSAMLIGLCMVYLALVGWFGLQFQDTWPYIAFGWLAASKLAWIVRNRRVTINEQTWLKGTWAISVVAYLVAVGLGATDALPRLGIVPAIIPSLHLSGSSGWSDAPYKAVASAFVYFASVAVFKWMYVAIRKIQPSRYGRSQSSGDAAETLDPAG